jgi:DNA-directed RNA polymerase
MEVLIATLPYWEKPTMMQNIASQVGNKLGYKDIFDAVEIASDLITCVAEADLIDITKIVPEKNEEKMFTGLEVDYKGGEFNQKNITTLHVQSCLKMDDELLAHISIMQYPLPMIVTPKEITNNREGHYLTFNKDVILGLHFNQHDNELAYDVMNITQNIPLSIDVDVLPLNDHVRHKERDKDEEAKKKMKILTSFKQFDKEVDLVVEELLAEDNKFYLGFRPDKRGRFYCAGYHISYQSNSYGKAMINFHKKQLIT